MAGVANTGTDRNWTGHHFAQSNWYAFGRLAWNPDTPSRQIADEWIKMTLTREPKAVASVTRIMLESHEAAVDYMTPLGLHHLIGATVAFIVAVLNNFWWNRHWTFKAGQGHAGFQAARFFIVSVAAFLFAASVLELLVSVAGVSELPAQAIERALTSAKSSMSRAV